MTKAALRGENLTNPATQQTSMNPTLDAPEWVAEMYEYYREHGYYRATDVQRGLGNPTASVGRALRPEPLVNLVPE